MLKRIRQGVLLLIGYFFTVHIFAQQLTPQIPPPENTEQTHYIYADKTIVRAEASDKSAQLDVLIVGDKVTYIPIDIKPPKLLKKLVKHEPITRLVRNGIEGWWILVEYQRQGETKQGHVWQRDISEQPLTIGDVQLVYGLNSLVPNTPFYSASIKAIKDGQVISKQDFKTFANATMHGAFLDKVELSSVDKVILLVADSEDAYLGIEKFYFIWQKNQIKLLTQGYDVINIEKEHGIRVLLPDETLMENVVIKIDRDGENVEDDAFTPTNWKVKTKIYQWNGQALKELNQNWKWPSEK